MKLREFLEDFDDDVIYIGTNEGNGFVYIGSPNNEDEINNAFKSSMQNVEEKIRAKKQWINNLLPYEKWKAAYIRKKNKQKEKVVESEMSLETYAKNLENAKRILQSHRKYIDNFVNPLDREVVDSYTKVIDGHTAIIVTGKEEQGFWLKREYDNKFIDEEEIA